MCVRTHRVILRCFRYRMFPEPAGGYVVATRWCIFTRAIPEITESRWKEEDGKGFVYFPLFSLFLFFFFHFSPVHFLIQPFRPQVERFAVHTITPPPLASCTKIFIVPDQVTHGYRTTWKVNEPRVYKDFAVSFFFFSSSPPSEMELFVLRTNLRGTNRKIVFYHRDDMKFSRSVVRDWQPFNFTPNQARDGGKIYFESQNCHKIKRFLSSSFWNIWMVMAYNII